MKAMSQVSNDRHACNVVMATLLTFTARYSGKSRIHLNIERWRVCEAWFSPTMAGVDSAGLGEVLQTILSRFSDAEKGRLVKVCFSGLRHPPLDNDLSTANSMSS